MLILNSRQIKSARKARIGYLWYCVKAVDNTRKGEFIKSRKSAPKLLESAAPRVSIPTLFDRQKTHQPFESCLLSKVCKVVGRNINVILLGDGSYSCFGQSKIVKSCLQARKETSKSKRPIALKDNQDARELFQTPPSGTAAEPAASHGPRARPGHWLSPAQRKNT